MQGYDEDGEPMRVKMRAGVWLRWRRGGTMNRGRQGGGRARRVTGREGGQSEGEIGKKEGKREG